MAILIIGIDPGASGGIAHYAKGRASAIAMPDNVQDVNDYIRHLSDTHGKCVVFIEKVQSWVQTDSRAGKSSGITKMLANYEQLLTVIKINGWQFVQVHPSTWQRGLGVKLRKEETKTERKNRFKAHAQALFPEIKPNLKTCDALCVMKFGMVQISDNIDWVIENVENAKSRSRGEFIF